MPMSRTPMVWALLGLARVPAILSPSVTAPSYRWVIKTA